MFTIDEAPVIQVAVFFGNEYAQFVRVKWKSINK